MARLFAQTTHIYEDLASHRHWWIPAGEWREVPDDIAEFLVANHPKKLRILPPEGETFRTVEVVSPPIDRQMRPRKVRA